VLSTAKLPKYFRNKNAFVENNLIFSQETGFTPRKVFKTQTNPGNNHKTGNFRDQKTEN